jgi:hypothetical protein
MTCVAPSSFAISFAISRRKGTMSMAPMVVAPTVRAAIDRRASNCARAEGSETCTRSHIQRIHYGPGLNTAAERTEAFERGRHSRP